MNIIEISILALGILGAFLLLKTLRFSSKQIQVEPVLDIMVNRNEAAYHLSRAVQFKTISHQDRKQIDVVEFIKMRKYLELTFPAVHRELEREIVSEHSLLFTWKGEDPGLSPFLLMAHTDVVPVEPGTESDWTHPPFSGEIADGCIWGRGTMDDKLSALGILEAAEMLLEKGFRPRRTIYLAFGHDEEIGGKKGSIKMVELLQSRGVELDYVLDEGMAINHGIVPGISFPVAAIGIAEKGYISVELSAQGKGGHSSMPPRQTTVGILSKAICRLERNQIPAKLRGPTRKMFEYLGPEMSFDKRVVFANLWLLGPLLKRLFQISPAGNALIRTTTAPTMLEASHKENVLPITATAVVNFRIHPGDSIDSVVHHIRKTVNDSQVEIKVLGATFKNEPSPESETESESFKTLHRTIRQVFPEAVVTPSLAFVATDSRHYATLSRNVYRFLPLQFSVEDTQRIHGTDERIPVDDYEKVVKFYFQLIRNSNS